jgi:hypothetical protein
MQRYFIDIHFHPQLKAYNNFGYRDKDKTIWEKFDEQLNEMQKLNFVIQKAIEELAKDSQANLNLFSTGQLKGGIFALYPTERPMFDAQPKHPIFKAFLKDQDYVHLGAAVSGFPAEKVQKIIRRVKQKRGVDYFNEELVKEYQFILNQPRKNNIGEGEFEIAENYNHYQQIINKSEQSVAVILSVEGLHSLIKYEDKNFRIPYEALPDNEQKEIENQIKNNIKTIKNWHNGKHAPFFVTFCHHYYNQLAGHAKSLSSEKPNLASGLVGGISLLLQGKKPEFIFTQPGIDQLFDQSTGMYPANVTEKKPKNSAGFNSLGIKVRDWLLSRENGRRILIDTKHMSLNSRKQYINFVKEKRAQGDIIPIIASHTCCNGFKDFESAGAITENSAIEKGEYFSRWSINLNDEEIRAIHDSNGIIGLLFHDGRMPGEEFKKSIRKTKNKLRRLRKTKIRREKKGKNIERILKDIDKLSNSLRKSYTHLLMSNVFQIIQAVNKKSAWDTISIGSDYDGLVDPLDSYYYVKDYPKFFEDMLHFFKHPNQYPPLKIYKNNQCTKLSYNELKTLYFDYSPEELAIKIAHKNAENFLKTYFTDEYLEKD